MSRTFVALGCTAAAAAVVVVVAVGSRASPPSPRPPSSPDELCRAAMLTAEDGEGWVEVKSAREAWIGGAAMSDREPLAQYVQEMILGKVHATIGYAVYEDAEEAEAGLQAFAKAQMNAEYHKGAMKLSRGRYVATTTTAGSNLWTSHSMRNDHPRVMVRLESLLIALSFKGEDPRAEGVMAELLRAAEVIADKHSFLAIPDAFRGILVERGEVEDVEVLSVGRTDVLRPPSGEGEVGSVVPPYGETVRLGGITLRVSCGRFASEGEAHDSILAYTRSTSVGWDPGLPGEGGPCPGEECWHPDAPLFPGVMFRVGGVALLVSARPENEQPIEQQQEAVATFARLMAARIRAKEL